MSDSLARSVYDVCHLTGTFRLRSGEISAEYFDKYLFEGQPGLLREVAEAMVALIGLRAALRHRDLDAERPS